MDYSSFQSYSSFQFRTRFVLKKENIKFYSNLSYGNTIWITILNNQEDFEVGGTLLLLMVDFKGTV